MRQTRENVVKLLKAMAENTQHCAEGLRDDAPDVARGMHGEVEGMQCAIWLLTDANYFREIEAIYFPSDGE